MLQYSTYTQVEQCTHMDERILLDKAHLKFVEESMPTLGMVHKKPVDTTPKAAVLLVHGFAQNRYTWHGSKRLFSLAGFERL